MPRLTPRLEAVAACIGECSCFADIGSDHAYLAAELLLRGAVKSAIAADKRRMPLESGKKNAHLLGLEMEFVLSDGFDALAGRDIDCAALCGMGGETITDILSRADIPEKMRLVLQPQSAPDMLRGFLWQNGFEITDEAFVTEGFRPYAIICARKCGHKTLYSFSDLYLGQIRPQDKAFDSYTARLHRYIETRRDLEERAPLSAECRILELKPSLVLASASPRRSEICRSLHIDYKVIPAECEAELDNTLPHKEAVERVALSKASEVAEKHPAELVLAADTVVFAPDGSSLGKPKDAADAHRMLSMLSGSSHTVVTGVCIIKDGVTTSFADESTVVFRELTGEQINNYIESGEPFGKAGAYAIQGMGQELVKSFSGSLTNIIGLPREKLAESLIEILSRKQ